MGLCRGLSCALSGTDIYRRIRGVVVKASEFAADQGLDDLSSRLRRRTSDALRRAALRVELPGSWLWRFVAADDEPSAVVFEYLRPIRMTSMSRAQLEQGLLALQPLLDGVAAPAARLRPFRGVAIDPPYRIPAPRPIAEPGQVVFLFGFGIGGRSAHPSRTDQPRDYRYSPERIVHRSLERYIRNHVFAGHWGEVAPLIRGANPDHIASSIEQSELALLRWAFVLWSFTLEPTVHRRRWLGPPSPFFARQLTVDLQMPDADLATAPLPRTFFVNRALSDWTRLHRAGQTMLSLWAYAVDAAEKMALTGNVRWGPTVLPAAPTRTCGFFDPCHGAELRIEQATTPGRLVAASCRSKSERIEASRQAEQTRSATIARMCAGHCLAFDGECRVVSATLPLVSEYPSRVRRRKLLGVHGRPKFWIFRGPQGVIARLCDVPLEGKGATWREAIEGLRDALRRQLRAGFPLPTQSAERIFCRTTSTEERIAAAEICWMASRSCFWRDGEQIVHAWRMFKERAVDGPAPRVRIPSSQRASNEDSRPTQA